MNPRMHLDLDPRSKSVPTLWLDPLRSWETWLISAGRGPNTIRTRTDHLRRAARALQGSPWTTTSEQLLDWVGRQTWKRETRRSVYASLRSFYWWACDSGHVDESPADMLPHVPAEAPCPRPCPDPVIDAAGVDASDRVGLMLRLGAELGLRRMEIAQVHEADLYLDSDGWCLYVHGKGDRNRVMPVEVDLALELRAACHRGGGWAFPGKSGHLTAAHVGKLISQQLPDRWTGHTLRHRFATTTHEETQDLLSVSELLGHSNVATTQRYIATSSQRLRAVAATASR
jgi:integrase